MNLVQAANDFSNVLFLAMVAGIPCYGALRGVKVYDAFVDGAKNSFDIALKVFPNLVAIIVGIGMLRASGALTLLGHWLSPVLKMVGFPPQVIPLAVIRPFSGSAANGILADLIHHFGANSMIAKIASTMLGSTETTFYVIAVYFGAVKITRTRHAIPAGLLADIAGIVAAVWICHVVFGVH